MTIRTKILHSYQYDNIPAGTPVVIQSDFKSRTIFPKPPINSGVTINNFCGKTIFYVGTTSFNKAFYVVARAGINSERFHRFNCTGYEPLTVKLFIKEIINNDN